MVSIEDWWRVRFASQVPGIYQFRTVCSDPGDAGLHGQEGEVTIIPCQGDNPGQFRGTIRGHHIQLFASAPRFKQPGDADGWKLPGDDV